MLHFVWSSHFNSKSFHFWPTRSAISILYKTPSLKTAKLRKQQNCCRFHYRWHKHIIGPLILVPKHYCTRWYKPELSHIPEASFSDITGNRQRARYKLSILCLKPCSDILKGFRASCR